MRKVDPTYFDAKPLPAKAQGKAKGVGINASRVAEQSAATERRAAACTRCDELKAVR